MPIPIAVPSSEPSNAPNHRTLFDDLKKNSNRLDQLERGSIRSGSVGGSGINFYAPEDDNKTYAAVGQFDSSYYDRDIDDWADVTDARGIAIYADTSTNRPWFTAAQKDGTRWINVGKSGDNVRIIVFQGEDVYLQSESDATLALTNQGNIVLQVDPANDIFFNNLSSIPSGFDLVLGPGFDVHYISSSIRYKQDIEDAPVDPADVLQMQSRTWRDKAEVEKDPETEHRYVGFIAEELMELPSLRQFLLFNDAGEPESIQYNRLSVALLELLKDQQKRLDDHEEKINQLTDMVKSLHDSA